MTGIVLGEVMPALDNPEPSETKLGRAWGEQIDWQRVQETADTPSVAEVAPLERRTLAPEMAYAPRWETATFRVPYGMRNTQFEAFSKEMIRRWFEWMNANGSDLVNSVVPDLIPGPNPSRDLQTGLIMPGYRDFLIRAQFVERQPEIVRLELPSELFEPWQPSQLPTSSGKD